MTAFCIAGGGALGAVLIALDKDQPINSKAWIVCIVAGLITSMKDIRATMALPPLSNGNYAAITQLMKSQAKGDTTTITKP